MTPSCPSTLFRLIPVLISQNLPCGQQERTDTQMLKHYLRIIHYYACTVSVADPESSEGGPRNMEYKPSRSVAIFFMTVFYRPRGG